MKRILIIFLCICASVCMAACGDKKGGAEQSDNAASQNGGIELPEDKFD